MSQQSEKKRRILVVDDDEIIRTTLKHILFQQGYEPVLTVSGNIAKQLLAKNDIDLVLSDINMPDGNGLDLLRHVQKNYRLPVVLMTGIKSIIDTKDTFKAGMVNFLAKPFGKEDLCRVIESCLPASAELPVDGIILSESAFCKIPIGDFISGKEIKYDIFIQLSTNNYVKIAHRGTSLPMERIQAYQEKGIDHLYLMRKDFTDYLKFTVKIGNSLGKSSAIPKERKLNFLNQTSKLLLQTAMIEGVKKETLDQGTEMVETTVQILAENDALFGLMDLMKNGQDDRICAHSLAVSLYACLMAVKLGWTSPNTLFYVAAGALFHDIGKKEIEDSVLDKPRLTQSKEERKEYETHPYRGAEILRAVPETPDPVIRIVMQHHENETGSGYPSRLRKGKIYPLAKLVAVADDFCDAIQRENCQDLEGVHKILQQMADLSKDRLEPTMIGALMAVFSIEVPAELKGAISVSVGREAEAS